MNELERMSTLFVVQSLVSRMLQLVKKHVTEHPKDNQKAKELLESMNDKLRHHNMVRQISVLKSNSTPQEWEDIRNSPELMEKIQRMARHEVLRESRVVLLKLLECVAPTNALQDFPITAQEIEDYIQEGMRV